MKAIIVLLYIPLLLANINCSGTISKKVLPMYRSIATDEISVYAFTHDSRGRLFAGGKWGRVFISTDDGQRWYQVNSSAKDTRVSALLFLPDTVLLVGMHLGGIFGEFTSDGIWALREQTTTVWSETFVQPTELRITSLLLSNSRSILVGTDQGVIRSSLQPITLSGIQGIANKWITCLAQSERGTILAGTFDDATFISTDNGTSWINSVRGLTRPKIICLAVQPDGTIYAGTDRGAFMSNDGAQSWSQIGLDTLNVESITFIGNWHIIAGTKSAGVFLTNDQGKTWVRSALSGQVDVWCLMVTETGAVLAGTSQGIFRSDDLGKNWNLIDNVFIKE
ncbi:MAG: hypothetical protein QME52_07905 [Bacteroidota bacterium]|nr:hypothetical protein [Bacteroidota bacterium]